MTTIPEMCPMCPRCDAPNERETLTWTCGSSRSILGGTIYTTDLCRARQEIKALKAAIAAGGQAAYMLGEAEAQRQRAEKAEARLNEERQRVRETENQVMFERSGGAYAMWQRGRFHMAY